MKKLLLAAILSITMSCAPSVLKRASTDGMSFTGTDIYYNGVKIAELSSLEYAYDHRRLVREMTYVIVDEDYNHLAINIIKFCLEKTPEWEVEVEIKR